MTREEKRLYDVRYREVRKAQNALARARFLADPEKAIAAISMAEKERFWNKVRREDECWLWLATKVRSGYGHFRSAAMATCVLAHRYMWIITNGPIPDGLEVCHLCDVPSCVNPSHLFLGTHTVNMRDMMAKGRGRKACGSASPHAVLNEDQVREIRKRIEAGEKSSALALEFGVTDPAIRCVAKGRTWKHVA